MAAETGRQAGGLTLEVEGRAHPIEFKAPADAERLNALLAQREQMRVQIDPIEEGDTEGHGLATKALVNLRILDEDDTEGHAISIHFPTSQEAHDFRNRLLMTGAIVGSVTLAGLGAGAALENAPGIGLPGLSGGTEVSDSWSRMGVPGTAAGAAAEADALTDSWQNPSVPGTGAAAAAEANQLTDSWQRMQTPGTDAVNPDDLTDSWQRTGTGGAAPVDPDTLTDSWQRTGAPGTGAATNADADELTDSWQRMQTPGTGDSDESEESGR